MIIEKQTVEIIPVSVDFVDLLPTGQVLQGTSDVKVFDAKGTDKTADMMSSSTIGNTRIDAIVKAGTAGEAYNIIFTAITQIYKFEEIITLYIVYPAF